MVEVHNHGLRHKVSDIFSRFDHLDPHNDFGYTEHKIFLGHVDELTFCSSFDAADFFGEIDVRALRLFLILHKTDHGSDTKTNKTVKPFFLII